MAQQQVDKKTQPSDEAKQLTLEDLKTIRGRTFDPGRTEDEVELLNVKMKSAT